MFLAAFLIGLREGLEAALIISILIAFVKRQGANHVIRKIQVGVIAAILLSLGLGAFFTFFVKILGGRAQEAIGGSMSILAVVMITGMIFWMLGHGAKLKTELESKGAKALAVGNGIGLFWVAFVSVGREGLETTIMLWSMALQLEALLGALLGLVLSSIIGYFMFLGMVRIRLDIFFTWTGTFLIIVAAGVLAYGVHDLQEAAILPGPFSGKPITPVDYLNHQVLVGFFTDRPYWGAAFPFGWAFDLEQQIAPDSPLAVFLKGTIGFAPKMSWLEVIVWAIYVWNVFPRFFRRTLENRRKMRDMQTAKDAAKYAVKDQANDIAIMK